MLLECFLRDDTFIIWKKNSQKLWLWITITFQQTIPVKPQHIKRAVNGRITNYLGTYEYIYKSRCSRWSRCTVKGRVFWLSPWITKYFLSLFSGTCTVSKNGYTPYQSLEKLNNGPIRLTKHPYDELNLKMNLEQWIML